MRQQTDQGWMVMLASLKVTYLCKCVFYISERFLLIVGSDGMDENGLETAKRDCLMPDLCVICLEREYNAVFVS